MNTIKIKKVLNSSVVLVEDHEKFDFILLGKGIGYGRKVGENLKIDESHQLFIPLNDKKGKHIFDLVGTIPLEVLELSQSIVLEAKNKINIPFNDSICFVLADHIKFAVERFEKGLFISNSLIWEVQSLYPKEYEVALKSVKQINKKLNINLPEEEAVNIVFHLVNAQMGTNKRYDTGRYIKFIGEIINIIKNTSKCNLDKQSMDYMRFISHIRYFSERFFENKMLEEKEESIYIINRDIYIKEVKIVEAIEKFLYTKYQKKISQEEVFFLIIYINLLIRK